MTARLTTDQLAELRTLTEDAQRWHGDGDPREWGEAWGLNDDADVLFIAAMSPTVALELLDAAEDRDRLAAEVERLRALIDHLRERPEPLEPA